MLKENQLIEVKMAPSTINWYKNLGYKYTKENFNVPPQHLPYHSQKKVIVICDFCGKEKNIQYRYYLQNLKERNNKYMCPQCIYSNKEINQKRLEKIQKTNLNKYGVDNVLELDNIRDKIKNTNLNKYGVEYTFLNENIKNKIKETFLEKYNTTHPMKVPEIYNKSIETLQSHYNVDNPMKSKEIKEKVKNTNLIKYGVEYIGQNKECKEKQKETNLKKYKVKSTLSVPEIKEKAKLTMLKKYGVENAGQSKELREKMKKTLFKYGKVRTSKQQKEIYNILKKYYKNCFLNFPEGIYNLDCFIKINNTKIDIEYDGWYWHNINNIQEKDRIRNEVIMKNGYKIFRIKGGKYIPSEEEIINHINILLSSNKNYTEIIMDDWKENIISLNL